MLPAATSYRYTGSQKGGQTIVSRDHPASAFICPLLLGYYRADLDINSLEGWADSSLQPTFKPFCDHPCKE